MEAMLFAVDKINNDTNLLNNITLGVNIQVIYFETKMQEKKWFSKNIFWAVFLNFYIKNVLIH